MKRWWAPALALSLLWLTQPVGMESARAQQVQTDTGTGTEAPEIPGVGLSTPESTPPGEAMARARALPIIQAGPVDPAHYVLGPGDVLELDLWGPVSRSVMLTVNPEGTLFLPGAGPLSVSGRTLAWSRDRILRQVAGSFRDVHADVRLVQLRNFKVYVTGFVKRPGAVQVNSATRASEALEDAGMVKDASRRNIRITRRDGSVLRVDLTLLDAAGRQDLDPTLVDGDVIHVPKAAEFVSVSGPVARPGDFELAPGDSLGTLLQLVGGPLPAAILNHVLMVRFAGQAERESVWINLQNPDSASTDFALRDGDHLFIHYRPDYHVLPTVGIFGEVYRPGDYPIVIGRDRLNDIVHWAGGFRPRANKSAISLLRETDATKERDPEFDRLVRLSRSEMTESEYAKFQTKLAERKNTFRVDWTRLQDGNSDIDPLLRDGDIVRVEPLVSTVRVEGEVRRPGFVDFAPGRTLRQYVELSGGYTDRASRTGVRVSRSLTGQVIPARSLKTVQPGDFIWVPERRDVDAWSVFRDIVTVGGQLAVIIFTLTR